MATFIIFFIPTYHFKWAFSDLWMSSSHEGAILALKELPF